MTDFRIWGRIEHIGPNQFLAIASSVREDLVPEGTRVFSDLLPCREDAERALGELVSKMGEIVRHNGGRVADVEIDGI